MCVGFCGGFIIRYYFQLNSSKVIFFKIVSRPVDILLNFSAVFENNNGIKKK